MILNYSKNNYKEIWPCEKAFVYLGIIRNQLKIIDYDKERNWY